MTEPITVSTTTGAKPVNYAKRIYTLLVVCLIAVLLFVAWAMVQSSKADSDMRSSCLRAQVAGARISCR